ncbi:MAG: Coenzyme F420 hydrogenase/dehydrogenase, beta subunit C-terminal domain [Phycisphaerales bacterium JB054]
MKLRTIEDISRSQLCSGCGACAGVAPQHYHMVDVSAVGRRPERSHRARLEGPGSSLDPDERAAMAACPGIEVRHTFDRADPALVRCLRRSWGPVYEVWEGHATDEAIRRAGSSGGAATALALWALERGGMHGALHTSADPARPYLNRTVLSRSREELLRAAGSRYAPASPCEGLPRVKEAPAPCVFIGKPCDVAGAQMARRQDPQLNEKLGLIIAFFCAGTPSTQATLDLMKTVGVEDPSTVTSLRYRGHGWPGDWKVRWDTPEGTREATLSYSESWDFLQRSRQWRCYICPDHTGELADIAVGDPWYRPIAPEESGSSLIIARTHRGLDILRCAARDGYLTLSRCDSSLLPRSQPNLLRTRGRLWGQLLALRLTGAPTPRYSGFPLLHRFLRLTPRAMAQSLLGTVRRYHRKCSMGSTARPPVTQEDAQP